MRRHEKSKSFKDANKQTEQDEPLPEMDPQLARQLRKVEQGQRKAQREQSSQQGRSSSSRDTDHPAAPAQVEDDITLVDRESLKQEEERTRHAAQNMTLPIGQPISLAPAMTEGKHYSETKETQKDDVLAGTDGESTQQGETDWCHTGDEESDISLTPFQEYSQNKYRVLREMHPDLTDEEIYTTLRKMWEIDEEYTSETESEYDGPHSESEPEKELTPRTLFEQRNYELVRSEWLERTENYYERVIQEMWDTTPAIAKDELRVECQYIATQQKQTTTQCQTDIRVLATWLLRLGPRRM